MREGKKTNCNLAEYQNNGVGFFFPWDRALKNMAATKTEKLESLLSLQMKLFAKKTQKCNFFISTQRLSLLQNIRNRHA